MQEENKPPTGQHPALGTQTALSIALPERKTCSITSTEVIIRTDSGLDFRLKEKTV